MSQNLILCQSLEHKSSFSPHPAGMGVLKKAVDEGALSCHCPGSSQPSLLPAPLFPCSCSHRDFLACRFISSVSLWCCKAGFYLTEMLADPAAFAGTELLQGCSGSSLHPRQKLLGLSQHGDVLINMRGASGLVPLLNSCLQRPRLVLMLCLEKPVQVAFISSAAS